MEKDNEELMEEDCEEEEESSHCEVAPKTKLDDSMEDIIEKVVDENDPEKLKDLTGLFNQNLLKKNLIRMYKVSGMLDDINEEAKERINLMGDSLSHRDIVEYMKAFQSQIDTSKAFIDNTKNDEMIKPIQNNTTININGIDLDRDSRNRILDFVNQVMSEENDDEVIDVSERKDDDGKETDKE